ncbi:conserved hypothetical protein [Corynebacterium striatum]|nr:conserved hypothetical protein [Corynebacterium striatum]
MPNPTRQEIIEAYRELDMLLGFYDDRNPKRVPECRAIIEKALPPRPQPTMADVEWDDDEHYLAEAEYPYHGRVIMLSEKDGWIKYFDERERKAYDVLARALTPTGKRYTLTEVQE